MILRRVLYGRRPLELFNFLLERFQPDLVLDVGSRDATESLRFRSILPNTRIVAIEANPELVAKMQARPELKQKKVEVRNLAASREAGELTFHIFNEAKGQGSLLEKTEGGSKRRIVVRAGRLDREFPEAHRSIAMWVDTEGHAYAVFEGCDGFFASIACAHVELERTEFYKGQVLYTEFIEFMRRKGFRHLARGPISSVGVGNYIFVRKDLTGFGLAMAYQKKRLYNMMARWAERSWLFRRFPAPFYAARRLLARVLG